MFHAEQDSVRTSSLSGTAQRKNSAVQRLCNLLHCVRFRRSPGPGTNVLLSKPATWHAEQHLTDPMLSTTPQRILQRPTLYHYNSSRTPVTAQLDESSLLPPPRPARSLSVSPDQPLPGPGRTLVHMPSLTAFGGNNSAHSLSRSGHADPQAMERDFGRERSVTLRSRPSTGESFWSGLTDRYDESRSYNSIQSCME